jgi:hypothetical protein
MKGREREEKKRVWRQLLNVYLMLHLTCHLLSASWLCRLYLCRPQEQALHSPCPAGFVYLELSWMQPLLFSPVYSPTHNCSLFLFRVCRGRCPPPLSGGVCHALAAVTRLPLSKHAGGGGATPTFSVWLVYLQSVRELPSPTLRSSGCPASLLHVFFFQLLVYYSACFLFSFFPEWGSVCPGGYANLSQGCLWEYCMWCSSLGGLLLPSRVGAGIWRHRSLPGFSI